MLYLGADWCFNGLMNEDMGCTLYLVRHGETEWNKNHIVMGQMDSALTLEGIKQVEATAATLKAVHFDAIFSSDSPRTQKTAEIIKLERELPVQTSRLLRGRHFGHFEGKSSADYARAVQHLHEEKEKLTEEDQWKFKFGDDMESDEDVVVRFMAQLRNIATACKNETVLVVTHGGCIRTFLMRIGYAPYGTLPGGSFQNGGYVKVLSNGVDFSVKEVVGIKDSRKSSE